MADTITITAEARDRAGKGAARAARRAGMIPSVIYGDKQSPVMVSINAHSLLKILKDPAQFTHLYDIKVGKDSHHVLMRDVQLDPVTDIAIHIDFLRVSDATKIEVEVPVRFINEDKSPGIKRGGVLNVVRHEVEVTCRASAIPEVLVIDLTGAQIGDSLHISNVKLPDGVAPTITDRDFTIATVAAPTVVSDEASDAQEGEEDEGEEEEGEE